MLTDSERAELVNEVNKIISDNDYHIQKMDTEKASVPIVDMFARLQAALAVPEPEPGLDEMLDSVHPEARVSLYYVSMPMVDDPDPYWIAQVRVPAAGFVGNRMCEGTGPTRKAAIQDAVRRASAEGERE